MKLITNGRMSRWKMNKYWFPTLFKKKRVELGEGHVVAFTLFEWKYLFSIIIYQWKTIKQNRFHSHAFPAWAFLLRGQYEEEVYTDKGIEKRVVNQWMKPRWLPRNYTHRILQAAPKTWTIIFVGPWHDFWYEWFEEENVWVKYTWGRKVVEKKRQLKSLPWELLQNKEEIL